MLVLRDHVILLKFFEKKEEVEDTELRNMISSMKIGTSKLDSVFRLNELRIQGFITSARKGNKKFWKLTDLGKYLLEIIKDVEDKVGNVISWDFNRWIGSDIIHALLLSKFGAYVEDYDLERRGFYDNGVTSAGLKVLSLWERLNPRIVITPELLKYGKLIYPGLAGTWVLEKLVPKNVSNLLEASEIITLSVPYRGKRTFSLTPFGRQILIVSNDIWNFFGGKAGSILIDSRMLEWVYKFNNGEALDNRILTVLEKRGLISNGIITDIGKKAVRAYEYLMRMRKETTIPFGITKDELFILKLIRDLEREKKVRPTLENIKVELENRKYRFELRLVPFEVVMESLEALGLIEREFEEEIYYKVTKYGNIVAEHLRDVKELDVRALKAVFIAKEHALSPTQNLIDIARKEGLLEMTRRGVGKITYKGKIFIEVARNIKRKFHLTNLELKIVQLLPINKALPLDELVLDCLELYEDASFNDVKLAIYKLESKGIISILSNDFVILTEIGRKVKDASVYMNMKIALSYKNVIKPIHVDIMRIIFELDPSFGMEPTVINEIRKRTGLTVEEIKKILNYLRVIGMLTDRFILTEGGKRLLEAAKMIEENRGYIIA